ncbi:prealbumin-like fold domain-containing protein, partial [Klebsiella pneumoniae]|nr:prealbumin-like fold domain-containing protein [Klebsiella pneumoniae]
QGKNNKPIQNAVFEVRNAANTLVATLTTDAEGKAQTGLLPLGTYTLTETSVPSPYVLDPTPITMTLTYKDMNTPVVVEA